MKTLPKAKIQEKPDCSLYDVNVHLLEKKIQIIFDIRREYMSTLNTTKMVETTVIDTKSSQILESESFKPDEDNSMLEVSIDDLADEGLVSAQQVLSPESDTQSKVSKKVTSEPDHRSSNFDLQSPERPSTQSHQIIRQPPVPKQRTIKVVFVCFSDFVTISLSGYSGYDTS